MARKSVRRTISLPPHVDARAEARVRELDTDFSNYIQQLIRRDVGLAYIMEEPEKLQAAEDSGAYAAKKGALDQPHGQHHSLPEHDQEKPA